MQSPQQQAQFAKMGFVPEQLTLDSFKSFVQSENSKYGFLIKAVKIRAE